MKKSIVDVEDSKKSLLTYFITLSALCLVLQILIALYGSHITIPALVLLVLIYIYYAWYNSTSGLRLKRLRFGRLIAHIIGFLTVNLSFHIHAFILYITNNPAIRGAGGIDAIWFGVLFGMMSFWGLALLGHMVTSIYKRGFEEL